MLVSIVSDTRTRDIATCIVCFVHRSLCAHIAQRTAVLDGLNLND